MAAAKVMWRTAWSVSIAVLVVGGCGKANDTVGGAEATVSSSPVEDDTNIQIPTLSPANLREADEIMSSLPSTLPELDQALLEPLSTLPVQKRRQGGPWHSGADYRLVGVTRDVTLPHPVTLGRVSLPDTSWDLATDDYTPFGFHYDSIVGLRKVNVLIDLQLHRVVAIRPTEATEINESDKTVFPIQIDGGEG